MKEHDFFFHSLTLALFFFFLSFFLSLHCCYASKVSCKAQCERASFLFLLIFHLIWKFYLVFFVGGNLYFCRGVIIGPLFSIYEFRDVCVG